MSASGKDSKDLNNEIDNAIEKLGFEITSKELASLLDEQDPLRELRQEFFYPKMKDLPEVDLKAVDPEDDCVYLCGHSLGLRPKGVENYFQRELDKWAKMGVYGHHKGDTPWADCDLYTIDECARIAGAKPEEIAVMNGLTVNIHLLMVSFYRPTASRHKILLESKAFPSDHYAIESQIRFHGYDPSESMICLEPRPNEHLLRNEDILEFIRKNGQEIALIFFSSVQYYTGQLFNMASITAVGQEHGCVVGWDAAHAAGNVPLKLHDWGVDFAVWCTYKYMNTCAGGLSVTFVHEKHANNEYPRFLGWWSAEPSTRFYMDNKLQLASGAAGYRISNPPIFLVCPLLASLDVFAKTDMQSLRRKSLLLTGYLERLLDAYFGANVSLDPDFPRCEILTPRNPQERGCALALRFSINVQLVHEELTRRGVVCDVRLPDVLRVAPIHMYNSFGDVYRFVEALKDSFHACVSIAA